jgi:hypothetical protein
MSAIGYDLRFAFETIWKVALASLILGAGLPVLFAAGIRSLAWGAGGTAEVAGAAGGLGVSGSARPNPVGKVLASVIFLLVAYAIVSGIVYVIATGKGGGYDITFKHLYPEIYKKAS